MISSKSCNSNKVQVGLDFYADKNGQRFFYCADRTWWNNFPADTPRKTDVYRFDPNEKDDINQEFVGTVDFDFSNGRISPCGQYFWSIQVEENNLSQKRWLFRQIDVLTLKYVEYKMPEYDEEKFGDIFYIYFHHYSWELSLLLIETEFCIPNPAREMSETDIKKTLVFYFNLDELHKEIKIEPILLPDLHNISFRLYANEFYHVLDWKFGVFEDENKSLFFYHVSYQSKVYVLPFEIHSHEQKDLKWIEYEVEGEIPESWAANDDKVPPIGNETGNQMYYYRNGLVEYRSKINGPFGCRAKEMHDCYRLEFDQSRRICRSKHLFCCDGAFITAPNDKACKLILVGPFDNIPLFARRNLIVLDRQPFLRQFSFWTIYKFMNEKNLRKIDPILQIEHHEYIPSNKENASSSDKNEIHKSCDCRNKKKIIRPYISYLKANELLKLLL